MKFLIIGGAGYIGSHFVRVAEDRGYECHVYDNLSLGHRGSLRSSTLLYEADLLDSKALSQAIKAIEPDAIFHFAANALVGESVSNPAKYYRNNVEGVRTLLEAMKALHVTTPLIFSSSCAVFGVPTRLPIAEDDPKTPFSPYGRSKLMAEYLIEDYTKAYQLRAMSLRYFNACGAHPSAEIGEDHEPETHLIPNILRAAMRGETLKIFGSDFPTPDGTCLRDYIHVMDLAESHIEAALYLIKQDLGSYDVMHLGTGRGYSNLEIVKAVGQVLKQNVAFELADPRPGDPPALYSATDKARKILGFEASHSSLENIITTAWSWSQTHPNGFRSGT